MRKLINKKAEKIIAGACYFCPESDYDLLDVHRIQEGCNGGKYTSGNTVVVCSNCHRKIHSGKIVIDRKYNTTAGRPVLHYWIDGIEKWE